MDSLSGQLLVKSDGTRLAADSVMVNKDLVLFYFSAHWCGPCRRFTPILKEFYEQLQVKTQKRLVQSIAQFSSNIIVQVFPKKFPL